MFPGSTGDQRGIGLRPGAPFLVPYATSEFGRAIELKVADADGCSDDDDDDDGDHERRPSGLTQGAG